MPKLLSAFLIICLLHFTPGRAQDTTYIRNVAAVLASDSFAGRGYVKDGMKLSANFIASQMQSLGLSAAGDDGYFQHYAYPVNVFPEHMMLKINGMAMEPGKDFIVSPESRGITAKGFMEQVDSLTWVDRENLVAITVVNKLTWSVSAKQDDYTMIQLSGFALPKAFEYSTMINAQFEKSFDASNVLGMVKGTSFADSIIIVSAHFDHLGMMGNKTIFNGANDNASGVASMLGLAKYFSKHPLPYSIVFIAFSGEEAGLKGSEFYTNHPLFPLGKTKFLLNLDLMGNGEEGITVVNATIYPEQFSLLKQINAQDSLLSFIGKRGKAANSDHYWFSEKGVPSFFIYTLGARKSYHDVEDRSETLPWPEVHDLSLLMIRFLEQLNSQKL